MSIRNVVAKSTLSKGSPKQLTASLVEDWQMTAPEVPGQSLLEEERPVEEKEVDPSSKPVTASFQNIEVADNFLLSYFAMFGKKEPSDSQLHHLAAALGKPSQELEQHIFAMLARISDDEIETQDL